METIEKFMINCYGKSIMETRLVPPDGRLARLRYYSARYGVLHAIMSYLGRHCLGIWRVTGAFVTHRYLQKWLVSPGVKVVNLGGGSLLSTEWLTADMDPRADAFIDITKPLPLPNESIDGIFSEEVIEHIDLDCGRAMLKECFRVLKPGGCIRITTPSLNYFASRPLNQDAAVKEINDIFHDHGHRHIYSEEELCGVLNAIGFGKVTKSSYRDIDSQYGRFDSHPERFLFAPPEWSQYWEALKPN